jgi:hypothetical protein
MNRSTRGALAALLGVTLFAALAASAKAQTYDFRTVVDSNQGFDPFGFGCPALNDGGQVAFSAFTDAGVQVIVRADADGSLTTLADDRKRFDFLGRNPSINGSGQVSFAAVLEKDGEEILLAKSGGLKTVARTAQEFNFFGFDTSLNDAGDVAFKAELDEELGFDEGLFVGDGSKLRTIYLASTSQFLGDDSRPSINDAGQIAFEESLDDFTRGIFLFDGSGFVTVVDETSTLVDSAFNPQLNDEGVVAFNAFLDDGGSAIVTGAGGPLTIVADTAGPFAFFDTFGGPSINDGGEVAFGADLDTGESGIFTGPDPLAERVILTGDALGGSIVTNTTVCSDGLNDAGEVAFRAQLEDGRTIIAVATPHDARR